MLKFKITKITEKKTMKTYFTKPNDFIRNLTEKITHLKYIIGI